MTTRRMVLPKLTIGLDLGDRFSQLCALHAHGQVVTTALQALTNAHQRLIPARLSAACAC